VRVCDASILPGLSAPTALTCAALGYILGNRLRKELG
jgi:choline dehydrogenase-like flavoprotein